MTTRIARVLDRPDGAFGLEYDNSRGERNEMHLDARTYEGAIREAKMFLGVNSENYDGDDIFWDIE